MQEKNQKSSGCVKWAVGCGVVSLVAILVLAAGAYLVMKMAGGAYSGVKRMTEIVMLDNQIVNQSDFVPPGDGMLSLEQVQSLVYIQTQIKDAMGPEFESVTREYRTIVADMEDAGDLKRFRKLISLSGRLLDPLHRAKKAQIEAINQEGISEQEYDWLTAQAKIALGMPLIRIDFTRILEDHDKDGSDPTLPTTVPKSHPDNRKLLEPHRELMEDTLLLSSFGI